MAPNRYSQVPVIEDGRVRGVFSLWSLAHHLLGAPNLSPHDLAVEDVMEQIPDVTVADPLERVLEHLNRHDAVLVKSPHGVQAIATGTDVLKYFYRIAGPYVLLQEIELALRNLIQSCVSGPEHDVCIERALRKKYDNAKRELPARLDEMTFEDYRSIVTAKDNWNFFCGVLGRNRDLVAAKLEQIRRIRNEVFHFRSDSISVMDHQTLAAARDWLFDKATRLRDREMGGAAK